MFEALGVSNIPTLMDANVPYSARVLAIPNLLAYWKLIEAAGSNAADSSGNGYTATYAGVTLAQAAGPTTGMGLAGLWDGINDIVALPAGVASAWNPAEFSVSMWIKNADWASASERGAFYILKDGSNRVWIRKSAANTLQWDYEAGGTAKAVSKTSVSDSGWIHVGMTVSKSNDRFRAYYNGVQQGATVTGLGTWSGTPIEMDIGLRASAYWSGNFIQVPMYNRELTAAEMLVLGTAV